MFRHIYKWVEYRNKWLILIDFEEWKTIDDIYTKSFQSDYAKTESQIIEIFQTEVLQDALQAKYKELESWKKNNVYDVKDNEQYCISVRWAITPKIIDGKLQTKIRLCAWRFVKKNVWGQIVPYSQLTLCAKWT